MDKSSTYCVMPHLGLALQNESDFCCCNTNKSSWQDRTRKVMYVHSHDIKTSYDSHTRKIIATSLDNGKQYPGCQTCWDAESMNNRSKRQDFNQLFGDVTPLPDQPRVLIIKPGNTCNFACRMCNPVTSSSWYRDGYELEKENLTSSSWYSTARPLDQVASLTYNEYTRTFETIRNSFNQDNTEFWNTLKQWIENLVYIEIYGGEPFLIPAMFDLLEHGANTNVSNRIVLNIHTNASIFNQHYMDILSQYKQVHFRISIDSSDPAQLEYIRHKSNHNDVIKNSKKFKESIDRYPNITMGITNTITPLNVFYVDKINKELEELFNLPVNVNIVTTPEYDIRHLPTPTKQYLINTLSNTTVTNFLKQTIPGCDVEWPKFCQTTNKLDQLRGQSFAKTFTEWWNILEPHWVPLIKE